MADTLHEAPRFARIWGKIAAKAEKRGAGEHRRRMLAGISGRVVEIGCGQGLNFPLYPPEVTEVVAVEPEATLRRQAEEAAPRAPVPVTVHAGLADDLPVEDGSCDAVVTSLVLCSVPDQARALAEIRRVLRPGGELRFYEHVRAHGGLTLGIQRVADATIWPWLAEGCHLGRDTLAAMEAAGFRVEDADRFGFSPGRFEPDMPHVIGRAVRAG